MQYQEIRQRICKALIQTLQSESATPMPQELQERFTQVQNELVQELQVLGGCTADPAISALANITSARAYAQGQADLIAKLAAAPQAFIVMQGRMYQNKVFTDRGQAERSVTDRNDGAVLKTLHLLPEIGPQPSRLERIRMLSDELNQLREDQAREEGLEIDTIEAETKKVLQTDGRIEATKFYRRKTGWSLLESKDAVNRMMEQMR